MTRNIRAIELDVAVSAESVPSTGAQALRPTGKPIVTKTGVIEGVMRTRRSGKAAGIRAGRLQRRKSRPERRSARGACVPQTVPS